MTIVAHERRFVIGVDTHARTHTLAILAADGEHIDTAQFPTSPAGISRAIDWAARRTGADQDALWAIEGVGSYGANLARQVTEAGHQVVEAPAGYAKRRANGKSDPADAAAIAAATLATDTSRLRQPRDDQGIRAAIRVLAAAREDMARERTSHVNALTALLRTTALGVDARKPLTKTSIRQIASWRPRHEPLAASVARAEAVRLARRAIDLDHQLNANEKTITDLIKQSPASPLLDKTGIGPVTVAAVLVAWSHQGRVRSEAAFAALAGVNPIPASSGNTIRHRLNRSGDRKLNRALHMATITRMRTDPETRAYVDRRTTEGRTTKEIRRCLKRYLCRQIYRLLNSLYATPATT